MKATTSFDLHGANFNAEDIAGRTLEAWLKWGKDRFFRYDSDQEQKLTDVHTKAQELAPPAKKQR